MLETPRGGNAHAAPYTQYYTDPILRPLARTLHLPEWALSLLLLMAMAVGQVALAQVSHAFSAGGG
jgi:hypothetical protein